MKAMFQKLWSLSRNGTEAPAGDPWVERTLGVLDPATAEPRYWFEFRRGVMLSAVSELGRRRRRAELTVSDVVFSWSRGLVPIAMAAGLAAFVLLRPQSAQGPAPLRLEEILWGGTEVSASAVSDDLAVEISFAVDVY